MNVHYLNCYGHSTGFVNQLTKKCMSKKRFTIFIISSECFDSSPEPDFIPKLNSTSN